VTAPSPLPIPAHFLSPAFFGAAFQLLETGAVLSQAARYFTGVGSKQRFKKAGAIYLTVLVIFQSSLTLWTTWKTLVEGYGDWTVAFHFFWPMKLYPLLTMAMALPLQILVVHRCYVALRLNLIWASPYIFLLLFAAISGFVDSMIVLAFDFNAPVPKPDTTKVSTPVWLLSSAILDVAASATLLWHITQTRTASVSVDMNKFLNRVIRLLWETALPPAIWAVLSCITHFLITAVKANSFMFLWSVTCIMILGQLYALAYFINLNFRLDVQQERTTISRAVELKPTSFRETTHRMPIQVSIQTYRETHAEDQDATITGLASRKGDDSSDIEARVKSDFTM